MMLTSCSQPADEVHDNSDTGCDVVFSCGITDYALSRRNLITETED